MKKILAALFLSSFVPLPLAAQTETGVVFEMATTDGSAAEGTTTKMSAQGGSLRMAMNDDGSAQPREMIFRSDRREMIVIDHERRSYLVMDQASLASLATQLSAAKRQMEAALANIPEAQREMMEQMMGDRLPIGQALPLRPEVQATDERAEHSGYETVRYDVMVDDTKMQELWVTSWSNVVGAEEIRPAFDAMSEFMRDFVAALAAGPLSGITDIDESGYQLTDEVDGFPIVTRILAADGRVMSETTLRSAARASFDAAYFEPPADYSRQEMPR